MTKNQVIESFKMSAMVCLTALAGLSATTLVIVGAIQIGKESIVLLAIIIASILGYIWLSEK